MIKSFHSTFPVFASLAKFRTMSISGIARSAVEAQLRDEINVAVEMMPDAHVKIVQHLKNQFAFWINVIKVPL